MKKTRRQRGGNRKLIKGAIDGNVQLIIEGLRERADPDFRSRFRGFDQKSLLHIASSHKDLESIPQHLAVVRELLDRGADPNIMDAEGETPLFEAATSLLPDTVRILINRGANPNIKNMNGRTAIEECIRHCLMLYRNRDRFLFSGLDTLHELCIGGAHIDGRFVMREAEELFSEQLNTPEIQEYVEMIKAVVDSECIPRMSKMNRNSLNMVMKYHTHLDDKYGPTKIVKKFLGNMRTPTQLSEFSRINSSLFRGGKTRRK
jgi:hypothetical protein